MVLSSVARQGSLHHTNTPAHTSEEEVEARREKNSEGKKKKKGTIKSLVAAHTHTHTHTTQRFCKLHRRIVDAKTKQGAPKPCLSCFRSLFLSPPSPSPSPLHAIKLRTHRSLFFSISVGLCFFCILLPHPPPLLQLPSTPTFSLSLSLFSPPPLLVRGCTRPSFCVAPTTLSRQRALRSTPPPPHPTLLASTHEKKIRTAKYIHSHLDHHPHHHPPQNKTGAFFSFPPPPTPPSHPDTPASLSSLSCSPHCHPSKTLAYPPPPFASSLHSTEHTQHAPCNSAHAPFLPPPPVRAL